MHVWRAWRPHTAMLLNAVVGDPWVTLVCFAVILAGIPVYLVWKGGRSREVPVGS